MATREEVTNCATSGDARENIKGDIAEHERKNEARHLLLSTTYGLNSSHTKKIHVGLKAENDGAIFVPVVKLTGNHPDGICFNADTWQEFRIRLLDMILYFTEDQKAKPAPITIDNISISFTTAYGAKAILVTYTGNTDHVAKNDEVKESQPPPSKKRKTYDVGIVMQKITFSGLLDIAKCVGARLEQLVSILDTVNTCVQYVINEVELKLPLSCINRKIIELLLVGKNEEIERSVQTQITNLTFLDTYFNIVIQELFALHFDEIIRIICLKRGS